MGWVCLVCPHGRSGYSMHVCEPLIRCTARATAGTCLVAKTRAIPIIHDGGWHPSHNQNIHHNLHVKECRISLRSRHPSALRWRFTCASRLFFLRERCQVVDDVLLSLLLGNLCAGLLILCQQVYICFALVHQLLEGSQVTPEASLMDNGKPPLFWLLIHKQRELVEH